MFSSDKNVETIGQLVEAFIRYVRLQNEYVRLGAVEKTVRAIAALAMLAIVLLFVIIVCIYLSFAAAFAMTPTLGLPLAFGIVAAVYVVLLVVICLFRKRLIERPLVRLLAGILLEN